MSRSSSAISSLRSRTLRARCFRESLVATAGSRTPAASGLQAAQVRRRRMRVRFRTRSRTSSGAATIVLWSCCSAARRHLTAVCRVVRSTRKASTGPPRSLATPTRHPVRAASAAETASSASSLPRALRAAGSGPVTSSTGTPDSAQTPGNAGAVAPGGLDAHAQQLAARPEPRKHRPVSGPRGRERCGTEHRALDVHGGGRVQILVRIDAPDDPGASSGCRSPSPPPVHDGERVEPNSADAGHDSEGRLGQALIRSRCRSRPELQPVALEMADESGE